MKTRIMIALFICLSVQFTTLSAPGFCIDMSDVSYEAEAGLIMPTGDFGYGVDSGYFVGGRATVPTQFDEKLSIGVNLAYGMGSGSIDYSTGSGYYPYYYQHTLTTDTSFSIFEMLPMARYFIAEHNNMRFYGQGGVGMEWLSIDVDVSGIGVGSYSAFEFGFGVGGGVEFMENFRAEVMYKTFGEAGYMSLAASYRF